MKSRYFSLGLAAFLGTLSVSLPQITAAQVAATPAMMNFQGRLTKPDGTPVADGTYSIRFSLWDAASGGAEKWNQTLSSVAVRNGAFAARLDTNTANLFNGDLWMEIKIGSDPALTPRQQLVSVAYAMKANTVPDGSITADKLANDALNNVSWLLNGNAASASHFLGTTNSQPLVFKTNNAERMRLLANGNLGIGINNAATKLHLQDGVFRIGNTADNKNYELAYDAAGDYFYIDELGTGRHLVIKNGGNVGINTTTPTSPLSFRNADERKITFWESADDNNKFYGIDMAGGGRIRHWTGVNGSFEVGNYNVADGAFLNRFRVTNSGQVNIFGNSALEFGTNVAGKEVNAGKIGYQTFTAGTLDIVGAGTAGNNRKIKFWNEGGATFAGEIVAPVVTVTGGSDVAEPYNVAGVGNVKAIPGMVVCIDGEKVGQMRVAGRAYDKTVAGIISGANGINPGITLRQKGTIADGEMPVASIGRVWCWCDADANGAIEAGDMLTTSKTPGHAMKVRDFNKANGAVIGKAMSSLKSGKGLVLVLVSLK
jgi:hypothetical protein